MSAVRPRSGAGAGEARVSTIDFGDPRALADLATFVGRARQVRPDGAVRLQVVGSVLLTTVAVLEGSGLMAEGAVLGLRVMPVAAGSTDADLDATVSFAALADRLARGESSTLAVPPVTVNVAWGGLTPPRDGWEPVGSLTNGRIDELARAGIEEVANGTPEGAGAHAVDALRRRVWGRMSDTVPPIATGLAFGAHVLGFTGGAPAATPSTATATVSAHGRWTRLSTARGHVLVR